MRRQITHVSVGQTSKVIASLYFVVAVVIAVIAFIAVSVSGCKFDILTSVMVGGWLRKRKTERLSTLRFFFGPASAHSY